MVQHLYIGPLDTILATWGVLASILRDRRR
jgi:hypothetical protein